MAYTDAFGFSPLKAEIAFAGGSIRPAPRFDESVEWIRSNTHPDSFVYPPVVTTHRGSDQGGWVELPQSRRGAFLHALPTSHELLLDHTDDRELMRRSDAGFLVHLFGFICGCRCQFEGWWIDGRANTHPEIDHHLPRAGEAATVMGAAYGNWLRWGPRQRTVATNALYLHTRVPSFEFTWEAFQNQYLVADAAFALVRDSGARHAAPARHADRLAWMCDTFAIPRNDQFIAAITRIRNDLFHQTLWVDRMPGDDVGDEGWNAYLWIRALSNRFLLGALGLKGEYVSSIWWDLSTRFFHVQAAI